MLVVVQVSSIKTSRAGSNMPCSRIQRRRARATSSAAYRVFFEADAASLEEPPNRAAAARDPSFGHRRNDLVQRQIRLLDNQSQQKVCVFLQRLGAAATWLCRNASGLLKALCPKHYHTGAEFVSFGHLATRRTGLDRFDHSCTQVVGIRPRHRSPPQNRINAARLARRQTLGNPPDSVRAKYALILIGLLFILPTLGAQTGVDVNIVWRFIARSTDAFIDAILRPAIID